MCWLLKLCLGISSMLEYTIRTECRRCTANVGIKILKRIINFWKITLIPIALNNRNRNLQCAHATVRLGWTKLFFYFHFYAWFCMPLKSMGESFLLPKDEHLTPTIDGVMALWFFRRRAQNTKIDQNSTKIGPLDPSFSYFCPVPLEEIRSNLFIPTRTVP